MASRRRHAVLPFLTLTVLTLTAMSAQDVYMAETRNRRSTTADGHETQDLELVFISNSTGYIQTPSWDGINNYPNDMDSWVRVDVPKDHVIMVSFPHFSIERNGEACQGDSFSLYIGGNTSDDEVLTTCLQAPKPTAYTTSVMHVHFVSSSFSFFLAAGFRLLFSFHDRSAVLEETPGSKWNCSVPYWADFKQHFPCNLQVDCLAGEDELECPYTSNICGLGWISVGGRCYRYIIPEDDITPNQGAVMCSVHGARLASLNTPDEWLSVSRVLRLRDFERVVIGLHAAGYFLPELYRGLLQWPDGSVAYFLNAFAFSYSGDCGVLNAVDYEAAEEVFYASLTACEFKRASHVLCELDSGTDELEIASDVWMGSSTARGFQNWVSNLEIIRCPEGHVTHEFLACDVDSACWGEGFGDRYSCTPPLEIPPPYFTCTNGVDRVPFAFVCDHRLDCRDSSDEDFCVFPPCDVSNEFYCGNEQCLSKEARCDVIEQCYNGADEKRCLYKSKIYTSSLPPPAVIKFTGPGEVALSPMDNGSLSCPETHFQCPGDNGYCLPVYTRCNGALDCPGREDEAGCDRYQCPGFYRCRASTICLHPDHVCDGVFQCPQRDDELLCEFQCPDNCTCYGTAFICRRPFPASSYPDLRYVDASSTGVTVRDFANNSMLVFLDLTACGITHLDNVSLPNLRHLDLSDNLLTSVSLDFLRRMKNLYSLRLSGNPLGGFFTSSLNAQEVLSSLQILDLSRVDIPVLNISMFRIFPNLQVMNLSDCGVDVLQEAELPSLKGLREFDLRGCPLTEFPSEYFRDLDNLQEVFADNYKLCCPATLPEGFNLQHCHAPVDEISSCDALLRSDVYRVLLIVFAAVALLGNAGSFIYRVFVEKMTRRLGFGVFVTHLCLADFLMGVYLAIIGTADRIFKGSYLWNDNVWKHSHACSLAGFLSLLSSEVSAFIICLITLDRFLGVRFPLRSLHFRQKSAQIACAVVWVVGLVLASVPLLPVTSHWQFYSQTGICIPLPITRNEFSGHGYSFSIFIVLNLVLFLFIAAGQVMIFWSVRSNRLPAKETSKHAQDALLASRLFTTAMSDFLCWFPIGVLGLIAATGTPVSGEVNVAMAIIVMPINSALNPFLYTLNVILEHRQLARERRLKRLISSHLQLKSLSGKDSDASSSHKHNNNYERKRAKEIVSSIMSSGILTRDDVLGLVTETTRDAEFRRDQIFTTRESRLLCTKL